MTKPLKSKDGLRRAIVDGLSVRYQKRDKAAKCHTFQPHMRVVYYCPDDMQNKISAFLQNPYAEILPEKPETLAGLIFEQCRKLRKWLCTFSLTGKR